jgi:glycosyltransferase involved in cell wall biosynthesis
VTTGIRWLSVGPASGYGDASAAYLTGLRAAGMPVSWTPLAWPSTVWEASFGPVNDLAAFGLDDSPHADIANLAIEHDTVVVSSPPFWHERLLSEAAGRRLIAYTTWETDRLHDDDVEALNHFERVLVPSRFNAAVLADSGVNVPIAVVPHGIGSEEKNVTGARPRANATFVFYLIATWTARKAIIDTVSAYLDAFDADDDVVLVIHTTPNDHIARWRIQSGRQPATRASDQSWFTLAQALAGRTGPPDIRLSTRRLSPAELLELHERGDCLLSLSRGEGWGLGAFEAGALGKPVIATGWGGTIDFLPPGYPYLAEFDLVAALDDGPDEWWGPRVGERWAKVRVDHAAALMREVFEHRDDASAWGRELQSNIHTNFNQARVTRTLLDALEG